MNRGGISLFAAGCFSCACLLATATAQYLGRSTAFVQRITTADFRSWEVRRDLNFSTSHGFVVYQAGGTAEAPVRRAIALKTPPSGDSILSYWKRTGANEDGELTYTDLAIAPAIAAQIEAAFRRLLEYKVFPPTASPYVETDDDYVWIFLRVGKKQAIAGTALRSALHSNYSQEALWFSSFMDDLYGLFETPSDQNIVLTKLDHDTAVFSQLPRSDDKR